MHGATMKIRNGMCLLRGTDWVFNYNWS